MRYNRELLIFSRGGIWPRPTGPAKSYILRFFFRALGLIEAEENVTNFSPFFSIVK
jgi:hypothetical protein